MSAPRSKPPAARLAPHRCTILAVDPGNTSGWALFDHGKLVAWGVLAEREVFGGGPAALIQRLRPRVIVLERPFRIRFQNQVTIGAGMKAWAHAAKEAGLSARTLRVYPPTWRKILPKPPKGQKRDRKAIRTLEAGLARSFTGEVRIHPDVAPAILIGRWAAYAGEVYALLHQSSE